MNESENAVTIHAIFMRHGEKDANGGLTEAGYVQAKVAGASLTGETLKTYAPSGLPRVEQTISGVFEAAPHARKLTHRTRHLLKAVCSPEFLKEFREHEKKGTDNAADFFLDFGKQRPDEGTLSPREVAQYFAHLLERYIAMAERINAGANIDLVHGTQQSLPEALLREVLIREDDTRGFTKLEEIGGALRFAEKMEFLIKRNAKRTTVCVRFRDKEYAIDRERLTLLAREYRDIKRA